MLEPQIGMRLVVRKRIPGGSTDVLGHVERITDDGVELATPDGTHHIARADVELIHELPPAPKSAGKLHTIVSAADLRRVSAATWLPADIAWLNADNLRAEASGAAGESGVEDASTVQTGWLLRAAAGVSKRANSALPLPGAGFDPDRLVDLTGQWYAERGLPAQVQIYSAAHTNALDEACAPLAPVFQREGFTASDATLALTAATGEVAAGPAQVPAGLEIVLADSAHAVHLTAWGFPDDTPEARQYAELVSSPSDFTVLSAIAHHPDGSKTLVGAARLAVAMKWAVVSNLAVDPTLRRRGAGAALVRAAANIASRRGIRSIMAEVAAGNEPSRSLFDRLGFTEHHRYWYATQRQ